MASDSPADGADDSRDRDDENAAVSVDHADVPTTDTFAPQPPPPTRPPPATSPSTSTSPSPPPPPPPTPPVILLGTNMTRAAWCCALNAVACTMLMSRMAEWWRMKRSSWLSPSTPMCSSTASVSNVAGANADTPAAAAVDCLCTLCGIAGASSSWWVKSIS